MGAKLIGGGLHIPTWDRALVLDLYDTYDIRVITMNLDIISAVS